MKKLVLIANIVDEETFIKEVVNEMPVVMGAKYEVIDMEYCIMVEDGYEQEAKQWLMRHACVRAIIC